MAAATKFGLLVRNLSTSSALKQSVKVPVQVFGVEGRYATALYLAASKQKSLDETERNLIAVQDSLKKNTKLKEILLSPIINRKDLIEALKVIGDKAKFTPASTNFLQLLAENGRLKKFDNIINAFKTIMAGHRGEVICEVTTAKPLDAGQRKKLEDSLKSFLKEKEVIKITTKVNPEIIGGMIVAIGDKYVDMSIASKVKRYTEIISGAV